MLDPTSYAAIGWLLVGIVALIVAVNQVDDFFQRRKDKPTGGEVQQHATETFATKEDLKEHSNWDNGEHNNLFKKIGGVERGAAAALKSDVDNLRSEITGVAVAVGGIQKGMEFQNQQLASLQASMLALLNRGSSSMP